MGTTKVWIGFLLFGIAGLLLYFFVFKQRENSVVVTVDANLSLRKVRIERGGYSINSDSDEALLAFGLQEKVFVNGEAVFFEKRCGENDFLVVYDGRYYAIIRHFIFNDFYNGIPEAHSYYFDFKEDYGRIRLSLKVKGEFAERFEVDLISVDNAAYSLWGRPLEINIEEAK